MTKFEYATFVVEVSRIFIGAAMDQKKFHDKLNEYGLEGWELINVFPICRQDGVTNEITAVFKRPLS